MIFRTVLQEFPYHTSRVYMVLYVFEYLLIESMIVLVATYISDIHKYLLAESTTVLVATHVSSIHKYVGCISLACTLLHATHCQVHLLPICRVHGFICFYIHLRLKVSLTYMYIFMYLYLGGSL